MRIDLHIAGYRMRLTEAQDHSSIAWPMTPFNSFDGGFNDPPDLEVSVQVVQILPAPSHEELLFDACHGLWRMYKANEGFLLESLDTQTCQPRSYALIDSDYSHAEVWALEEEIAGVCGWTPMKIFNPIVEICLLTKLAKDGGGLLHSAGLLTQKGGYIFTGSSDAGKSTIAEFFANCGASVLSDERTIIRRNRNSFSIHGTPWVGSGAYAKNESGPLTELYCIRHGQKHRTESMSPSAVMSFLLPQCFLPHWDRTAMESTLAFLSDLITHVPCQRLSFAKHPDVVEYIQNQVTRTELVAS
jgi:hypothetical protein